MNPSVPSTQLHPSPEPRTRGDTGAHAEAITYVHTLAAGILPEPASLRVRVAEGEHGAVRIVLATDPSQRPFLIGRAGANYNAMSTLVRAFSGCVGRRYMLSISEESENDHDTHYTTTI